MRMEKGFVLRLRLQEKEVAQRIARIMMIACMYVCLCVCVRTHIYAPVCMYVHLYVCVCVSAQERRACTNPELGTKTLMRNSETSVSLESLRATYSSLPPFPKGQQ